MQGQAWPFVPQVRWPTTPSSSLAACIRVLPVLTSTRVENYSFIAASALLTAGLLRCVCSGRRAGLSVCSVLPRTTDQSSRRSGTHGGQQACTVGGWRAAAKGKRSAKRRDISRRSHPGHSTRLGERQTQHTDIPPIHRHTSCNDDTHTHTALPSTSSTSSWITQRRWKYHSARPHLFHSSTAVNSLQMCFIRFTIYWKCDIFPIPVAYSTTIWLTLWLTPLCSLDFMSRYENRWAWRLTSFTEIKLLVHLVRCRTLRWLVRSILRHVR